MIDQVVPFADRVATVAGSRYAVTLRQLCLFANGDRAWPPVSSCRLDEAVARAPIELRAAQVLREKADNPDGMVYAINAAQQEPVWAVFASDGRRAASLRWLPGERPWAAPSANQDEAEGRLWRLAAPAAPPEAKAPLGRIRSGRPTVG
jgi:hypothetical protein